METIKPTILEIYKDARVIRIEASPNIYTNNLLATLAQRNGDEIHFQFLADPSRGQSAIDHIYVALMASLYSGRLVTIQTNGRASAEGYGYISNCTISAPQSSQ
ncbi:hypothetical protein [Burkholderia lata]|uniref:hypothetical protein n=1 Tax=Burkholderia lata (strain ATCC 17760 / DSM 23089 / LMG 22485 / NCIMB 9086 / R18194 / 383) TaxID=482957 RepID=UPI0012EA4A26|nr:hypothetical protein [Burkholderia lata]